MSKVYTSEEKPPSSDASSSPERGLSPLPSSPKPSQRLSGWRLAAVQLILCLGLLLSVMESSIVATALVTIGEEFNDFVTTVWSVLAYLLSYMGLSIVFARFSDVIGRKWAILLAWFIFTIFSLACGFAKTLDQLIAFRTLQGVGGSGLYTLTMVVIPEISPPKLFTIMSGCAGAVFALSAVLGPVLGGVITRQSTWRWIFWLNAPFGVVAMIVLLLSWPGNSRSLVVNKVRLRDVDWLGALLLMVGSVLLIFALQQAGSTAVSWDSPTAISTLTISAISWIAFAAWVVYLHRRFKAGKTRTEAIFPLSVVTRGKMAVVILTTFFTGFSFILVLIYLPERFQVVQLKDPIQAGINMLPMLCSSAIGSAIGGLASSKKNLTFYTLVAGNALVLLGCGLLSTSELSFRLPGREYSYQVLLGLGVGMTFATATIMTALEARFRDLAVAQGVVNQARVLGGSIGLAIATVVFNHIAVHDLVEVLTPEELSTLQKAPTSGYRLSLNKQVAVRQVFATSFNEELRVCTYVAAVSLVVSVFSYSKNPPDVLARKAAHDAVLEGRAEEDD